MGGFINVRTGGSSREIGFDIGRATSGLLAGLMAENREFYRQATGRDFSFIREFSWKNYYRPSVRRYPEHVAELRGVAEGSGIPFEDLFVFSCEEELLDLWGEWDKCSSALVRSKSGVFLAHNEDYVRRYRGRLLIVEAKPDRGPAFISLSYPGTLAGSAAALNSEGIAMSGDSLRFAPKRRGIPKNFILRDVLGAHSFADAVRRIRVSGCSICHSVNVVSADERRAAFVESSPAGFVTVEMGPSGLLVHTNHVLSPELDTKSERATWNSRLRHAGLNFLLAERRGRLDSKRLQSALSSPDYALLRRGKKPGDPETLASVVIDAGRRVMWVSDRSRGGHAFRRYGPSR